MARKEVYSGSMEGNPGARLGGIAAERLARVRALLSRLTGYDLEPLSDLRTRGGVEAFIAQLQHNISNKPERAVTNTFLGSLNDALDDERLLAELEKSDWEKVVSPKIRAALMRMPGKTPDVPAAPSSAPTTMPIPGEEGTWEAGTLKDRPRAPFQDSPAPPGPTSPKAKWEGSQAPPVLAGRTPQRPPNARGTRERVAPPTKLRYPMVLVPPGDRAEARTTPAGVAASRGARPQGVAETVARAGKVPLVSPPGMKIARGTRGPYPAPTDLSSTIAARMAAQTANAPQRTARNPRLAAQPSSNRGPYGAAGGSPTAPPLLSYGQVIGDKAKLRASAKAARAARDAAGKGFRGGLADLQRAMAASGKNSTRAGTVSNALLRRGLGKMAPGLGGAAAVAIPLLAGPLSRGLAGMVEDATGVPLTYQSRELAAQEPLSVAEMLNQFRLAQANKDQMRRALAANPALMERMVQERAAASRAAKGLGENETRLGETPQPTFVDPGAMMSYLAE